MREHKLLDHLIDKHQLKNDAALAKMLDTTPGYISKIRNGLMKPGATMIIEVHEVTKMSIKDIKALLA
jgi:transcriptional regulator with XRE-family HTH domain